MGVRIAFYETTDGKSLLKNFNRTFLDFREWLLLENKKSINEFNERIFSINIESLLVRNRDEITIKSIPQNLLDELITEYFTTYCDYGKGQVDMKLIDPLLSRHHYNNSFDIIEKTKDEKLIKFWNYLKVGRSFKDDKPFTEMESDLIGFWNITEMDYIKTKIKSINQYDVGIECISDVLAEIEGKSELIFLLEI